MEKLLVRKSPADSPRPQPFFTLPLGGCGVQPNNGYAVGPYDFATIYNVAPFWNGTPAIDGTGETIAIVGETDINPQDVAMQEGQKMCGSPQRRSVSEERHGSGGRVAIALRVDRHRSGKRGTNGERLATRDTGEVTRTGCRRVGHRSWQRDYRFLQRRLELHSRDGSRRECHCQICLAVDCYHCVNSDCRRGNQRHARRDARHNRRCFGARAHSLRSIRRLRDECPS